MHDRVTPPGPARDQDIVEAGPRQHPAQVLGSGSGERGKHDLRRLGPDAAPQGLNQERVARAIHRFRQLVTRARTAEDPVALGLLDQALGLWRGEAFGTLTTRWLDSVRDTLNAERHAAELDRNDLALAAGRHASLLDDLTERAAAHPLDERFGAQLLLALYRCGRQAEAMSTSDGSTVSR